MPLWITQGKDMLRFAREARERAEARKAGYMFDLDLLIYRLELMLEGLTD